MSLSHSFAHLFFTTKIIVIVSLVLYHNGTDYKRKNKSSNEVPYQEVMRKREKYVVEIKKKPNKKTRVWLGTFDFAIEAAKAYDAAAIKFCDPDKARTNFPIPKIHKNNMVIQTPTTINSSTTTTNPSSSMSLPIHVIAHPCQLLD